MKNFFKKLFSVILALVMVAVTFPTVIIPVAFAAETENWSYEIENGEVTITDYIGSGEGTIEIPSSIEGYPVTSLEGFLFSYNYDVTAVVIPSTVVSLVADTFYNAVSVESIVVNEDNPMYSSSEDGVLFNKDKTELICYPAKHEGTSYEIPDSVKTIGSSAFERCRNLTYMLIPKGVEEVGTSAFVYCSGLTSITIEYGASIIGDSAFENCYNLTSITLPDSVERVGYRAFYNTGDYNDTANWENDVLYISEWLIEAKTSITGNVSIKSGTKGIADEAFGNCENMTQIVIPNTVTIIGEDAFAWCAGLKELTMPFSAQIKNDAFYSCTNIEKITLTEGNGTIHSYVESFFDTPWYVSDCPEVVLEEGVTGIGDNMFWYCDNLSRITIPYSVTSVGNDAFYKCSSITKVSIPNSVTTIGDFAFEYCSSLADIVIPHSVESIGEQAFYGCENVISITISDGVTSIGNSAFGGCDSLERITVDENNTAYSNDEYGVLLDKEKRRLIQYPTGNTRTNYEIMDSVTHICNFAFAQCDSLTSITIPDSVTNVEEYAIFACDNLTSVWIGRGLLNIGVNAFSGNKNITLYGYKNSYVETYAAEKNINFSAYTSKVAFDANGGTSETAEKEVYTDCAIGSLPIAENSDRVFLGWYTELTGGECVTEDTVITEDCTLYAQWGDPVTSISLVMPTGVKYYVGDSLSNVGIKLKVNYYDGTTKTISSGFFLTPETLSESGSQTVTATYGDHSATATITVLSVQPVSVSVNKLPEKTTYLVGEDFNPKGMKIKVTYNNSTERIIADMSLLEVFYDFSSAGESIVYYSYEENGALVSDYFDVLIYKKPIVSADSISANAGETVTVPVRISDNCGLMGYNISVKYDSEILTPVSATQGSAISGGLFDTGIETSQDDSFNVIWSGSENVNQNGVLFNIVFEVSEKAIGETLIELGFNQSDTFNESFDDIQLTVKNAEILINNSAFEENTLIAMQDASGNAGEEISLKFILSNYIDTTATTVMLEYDSDNFTFVDAQSENISVRATDKGSYILIKLSGMDVSLNGSEIMTMIFKAKEYIEGEFDFELIYDQSVDTYGQAVACKGSKVTVTNLAADETASVYSEKINATIGEKIIVPVKISNNHGIMGYKLIFDYDYNALKPVSVNVGSKFNGNFAENSTSVPGRIYVVWNGNSDVTVDGDLLYIEFEVLQQGDTDILVSYSQGDTFNEAWEDVFLNCKNISVTVHPSELLFAKTGTSTVIDKTNKFIYGIPVGITSLDSYISVTTGYVFSVSGKIGTGAKVSITKNGEVADTYTVIIFGDVNGDGWYDGTDAVIVSCIVNGMLPQAEESVLFAADCNRDGTINETDVAVLEQAGVMLVGVDQTQSVQMLETQSAYIEYADLIVQTVEADFEAEDVTEDQTENEPEAKELFVINFIETLLAWIIKLFSVFKSVN